MENGKVARGTAGLVWDDKSLPLSAGCTILGRADEAGMRFDLPGVSRRHARIDVGREGTTLEDLSSRNGTYPRGERISSRASLAHGDEIRLGPVTLTFRLVSPESSTVSMA